MATQNNWTEFRSRSVDVQELVRKLVQQLNRINGTKYSAEIVYEDNEWGVFESSYLYRALSQMIKDKLIWDKDTILENLPQSVAHEAPESTVFTDEGDEIELESPDVITRTLNWFKSAAPEKSIREKAKEEYEQRILALYVEHIESTGQTFYPEMQAILENQFDFQGDS
jgi:hypothetical protein